MTKSLEEKITHFREQAKIFREREGSVEAVVTPGNAFAQLGITSIDGVPIVDEQISFMDMTEKNAEDVNMSDTAVYFHRDDHAMFGSRANLDDDEW